MKNSAKLLIILVVTAMVFSMVPAISFAVDSTNSDKTDVDSTKVISKSKTVSYKIIWNANGGKIGSKKSISTTVGKNSRIGKLPSPKRNGYTFKGWYTKKSGGIKIFSDHRASDIRTGKSTTYYAQWNKIKPLTAEERKLAGRYYEDHGDNNLTTKSWIFGGIKSFAKYGGFNSGLYAYACVFKPDRTYQFIYVSGGKCDVTTGKWYIHSKGIVTITNIVEEYYGLSVKRQYNDETHRYDFLQNGKNGLRLTNFNGIKWEFSEKI